MPQGGKAASTAPGPSATTPTGTGTPPASYPAVHAPASRKPAKRVSPATVTSPQGDSLSLGIPVVGNFNNSSFDFAVTGNMGLYWYYVNCTQQPAALAYGGADIPFCAYAQMTDSVSGATTTDNNTQADSIYDACGTLVDHDSTYGWHIGNTTTYHSAWVGAVPTTVPSSGVCYGQWTVSFTYSQTFTDGAVLTETTSGTFPVYPSQAAGIAARNPQPSLIGGPVAATETQGPNPSENTCQACAGDPVDTATGNFYETQTDLSVTGRGPALRLSRSYNSLGASTPGPFGYGWTDSYAMSLTINASSAVVTQDGGAQVPFLLSGSTWSPPPRVLATLSHNGNGTWTFARRAREVYTFDASGRLTAIGDLNGYTTTVSYPSSTSRVVTDPAGRTLTFTFTGSVVTSVSDSATPARTLSYAYDQAGNLTDVIDVGGGHWRFGYDGSHRMVTLRSPRFYGDTTSSPAPVVTNHYDSAGRIDWQSDQLGRTTTFDYTSIPGSTKVTDPKGNVVVDAYQYGVLTAKTRGYGSPQAATWYYRYDPATLGQVMTIDPNGHVTKSVYDGSGNPTSTTDALNRTTSYTYNGLGEVSSATEARTIGGQPITTTMTYDAAGNLLTRSIPLLDAGGTTTAAATTTYRHDDASHPGDLTSIIDPNGIAVTYTYDGFGDLSSATDGAGDRTTYGYDTARGWRTSVVAPKGNVSGGNPAAYTTSYAYDAYGRSIVVKDPLWTSANPTQHQSVRHYDADGNLDSVTDGNNHTTSYDYDAAAQQTAIRRPDGSTLTTAYWPDGKAHYQYDGANQATGYDYDPLGRLASVTDPVARTTTFGYDPAGNQLTRTDADGRITTKSYDAAGELTKTTYSDGITPNVTSISYDADGQRTALTDGTGTSTWAWDSLHRMTSSTNGAGQTVGYGYDLGGRLTTLVYPGTIGTVSRGYDNANRLHTVTDWNGRTTTFDYDPDSNLRNQAYPNATTAASSFDAADRLMGITDAPTANPGAPFATLGYGRDGANLISSQTATGVPADNHTFGYDPVNRLTGVDQSTYGYDAADNLTKQASNVVQVFDASHEITAATTNPAIALVGTASAGDSTSTSLTLSLPAGTTANDQVLLAVTLVNNKAVTTPAGYAVVGSYASGTANSATKIVVFRHAVVAGETAVTAAFGNKFAKTVVLAVYRSVHSATPVDVAIAGSTAGSTLVSAPSLTPTATGDRLVMITGTAGSSGSWTMPASMTTRVQRVGGTTDTAIADQALTGTVPTGTRDATHSVSTSLVGVLVALKAAQVSYRYDNDGNRIAVTSLAGATTSLAYDQADRLTGYAGTATYSYDGTGLRAAKTVSGVTTPFVWDQAEGVAQLLVEGATQYVYGPGGAPLEQITSAGTLYYHQDQLGSTRVMTNAGATVVATYTYDAYGSTSAVTGSVSNPFRFAGQYSDLESGLYYLRARYYDPATAQFTSRDPLDPVTRAPYSYVGDGPLNGTDPSGLCWPSWACGAEHTVGQAASTTWHPIRFVATLPETLPTLAVDKLGYGADCDWNGKNWVYVCYGGPTILGAPATTFGAVVNTNLDAGRFATENCGRLLAHETKHTDQWSIFGPVAFPIIDGVSAGGSQLFFGDNAHNPMEIWAGLKDGGYTSCC